MTLLNREHCRCEVCDTGATYARPGDYDEELGCLWARWGSERRSEARRVEVALGSTEALPGRQRWAGRALRGIWAWMSGRR